MFNFIATIAYNFLDFVIDLFPVGSGFPVAFHDSVQTLSGYLHILDPIIPINVLLTCVTLIFSIEIALFGFKVFRWIISHIPFIGGKGV